MYWKGDVQNNTCFTNKAWTCRDIEETVTGCFSLLNTWLAFDTQILLPNLKCKDNFLIKDEIGHLYMVDIIFDSKKQLVL